MEQSSIAGAGDCIHVANAIFLGASVFVSDDQHLRECLAEEVLATGTCRERIEEALESLTGVRHLEMDALEIQAARRSVERSTRDS